MSDILKISLNASKKIYFASDFHLGAPNLDESHKREKKIVRWLDSIKEDAQVIFLVGDLFDFWHEYKRVVPKGFVRFLGKIAELSDAGIEIIIFSGNHDLWMSDYFETELKVKVLRKDYLLSVTSQNSQLTTFYIAHGDGLGPGDYNYKLLKKWIFDNKAAKWAFKTLLHSDLALKLGQSWAGYSWRKHEKEAMPKFEGEDNEWLYLHAKEVEATQHHDFYIFGHRHIFLNHPVSQNSRLIILGDWIYYNSYAEFDGNILELKQFEA